MDSKRSASKLFQALIQKANDSGSFDTSLEVKSLPTKEPKQQNRKKYNATSHNITISYMEELRDRIHNKKIILNRTKENNVIEKRDMAKTSRKIPFICKKNIQREDTLKKYNRKQLQQSQQQLMCSTPVRNPSNGNSTLNNLNLLTPPADVRFIDSENRTSTENIHNISNVAVDGEIDDNLQNIKLFKCFSLTPTACRERNVAFQNIRSITSAPNSPIFEKKSTIFSSFRKKRSSIVSSNEESPLRRQKNVKYKNLNFFKNFLSPTKTSPTNGFPRPEGLANTCSMLNDLIDNGSETDVNINKNNLPELSEEQIHFLPFIEQDNEEFSFTCEPSHSDNDESSDMYQSNSSCSSSTSAYESCRSDETIEISPSVLMRPRTNSTCTINTKAITAPMRRSISNPNIIIIDSNGLRVRSESILSKAMCLTKFFRIRVSKLIEFIASVNLSYTRKKCDMITQKNKNNKAE